LASDGDKADFVARLGVGLAETDVRCLAWALMSNHYHLVIRVGDTPMSELMRKLPGGYAAAYNRRHRRVGYVFQSRYKSILCDAHAYLLALVRYVHLNPLKAGLVPDLDALDAYPWTGHSALLGGFARDWQDTAGVLAQFSERPTKARRLYREFVQSGLDARAGVDFEGGGLVRSYGGWENLKSLRREHERNIGDERILGDGAFVERALRQDRLRMAESARWQREGWDLERLIGAVCARFEVDATAITQRGRKNALSNAKAVICYLSVKELGLSSYAVAVRLGMSQSAVSMSMKRGEAYCREPGSGMGDL